MDRLRNPKNCPESPKEVLMNPKDSNVYRKYFVPGHSTPKGSNNVTGYNFYKHAIPSGLLLTQ